VGDRAAREQVEEADDPAVPRVVLQLLDLAELDERDRKVGADPIDDDDEEGEEDLVPEVGDPEHVPKPGEHAGDPPGPSAVSPYRLVSGCPRGGGGPPPQGAGRTSTVPPARSIAWRAAAEKACARTVRGRWSWPRPRTLISPRLATSPWARSAAGSTVAPA